MHLMRTSGGADAFGGVNRRQDLLRTWDGHCLPREHEVCYICAALLDVGRPVST